MYIIAEIGVNHDGDVKKAIELIFAAHRAGADAVKFQTFTAKNLATKDAAKVAYQIRGDKSSSSQYEMLERLEITRSETKHLWSYALGLGLDFLSTPYSLDDAQWLIASGMKTVKVASADIVDGVMLRYLAVNASHVILSTGMASLNEIDSAMEILGQGSCRTTLLQCTSNYPCSYESLNLKAITLLQERYGVEVGFSDHAKGSMAAIIARSLGCEMFEKHFTLSNADVGPDHMASSEPADLVSYINDLKITELILGRKTKELAAEEQDMRLLARKSIRFAHDLPKGHFLCEEDLVFLRPGDGLYPNQISKVLGKKLKINALKQGIVCEEFLE